MCYHMLPEGRLQNIREKKNESDNENIGSDYNYFFEMGCRWFREK